MDELEPVPLVDLPDYTELEDQIPPKDAYVLAATPILEEFQKPFKEFSTATNVSYYEAGLDFDDIAEFYDSRLFENGWESIEDYPAPEDYDALGYIRGSQLLVVGHLPLEDPEIDGIVVLLVDDYSDEGEDYKDEPEDY